MYIKFTGILNNFKSYIKVYSNGDMIRKLSMSLPRRQRGAKVMAIKEAPSLKTLKLEDLVRNF